MTDPRRLLSRLVAKTASWDTGPRDTSPTRLLPSDVQASLGMVKSRLGQALVLAKWCADMSMLPEAHQALMSKARTIARDRRWKMRKYTTLKQLGWLSIEELVDPNLCKTCGGAGERFSMKRKLRMMCENCAGTGLKSLSNRARARYCDVSEGAWRTTWGDRYLTVSRIVEGAHAQALGILRRNLE